MQKGSMCFIIQQHLEPFCVQPSTIYKMEAYFPDLQEKAIVADKP